MFNNHFILSSYIQAKTSKLKQRDVRLDEKLPAQSIELLVY